MKINLLVIVLIVLAQVSNAQQILGLTLVPNLPHTNDTVRIAISCEFSAGACYMQMENHSVTGSQIDISVFHCIGMLTVICYETDTITLGVLPAGTYNMSVNLFSGPATIPTCNHFTQDQTSNLTFNVEDPSLIREIELPFIGVEENGKNIYINGKISPGLMLTILDMTGKKTYESELGRQGSIQIPFMSPGAYIYCLRLGERNRIGKFIITSN